jgi:hypothetical protein
MKLTQRLLGIAALALGVAAAAPAPAGMPTNHTGSLNVQAVAENGVCEESEFCLYRGSNLTGRVYDFADRENDNKHRNDRYPGTQIRLYESVSSVWNRTDHIYTIYDEFRYTGNEENIGRGITEDLGVLENNNRSHYCHIIN